MVLKERGLTRFFKGIFGSPQLKSDIVSSNCERERSRWGSSPMVLCGDSRSDYAAAAENRIDFIMIYGYSEWSNWVYESSGFEYSARDFEDLLEFFRN